jgi:hypothetical protein
MTELIPWRPERLLDVGAIFGIDSDLQVAGLRRAR